MDERTLRVLEYDKVKALLTLQTVSVLGREKVEALIPATDPQEVARLQEETSQAREAMASHGAPPLGGIRDIRRPVRAAAKSAMLEPSELLDAADTLFAARRLRTYLLAAETEAPRLASLAQGLGVFRELEDDIHRCINPRAEVVEEASEALKQVRRQVHTLHDSINLRLETMLHSSYYQRMIQEQIVTIRNDRFCLPVRSEFKGEFRGIIHDASASGATVFMEPFPVVQLNNQLREARLREEEEVRRVLVRLSGRVGERAEEILQTVGLLGELDFIFGRALLARSMDACPPKLDGDGVVELWSARHPLLQGPVVPTDIRLGGDFLALVITGPNTGGKTVTLKTIGLLALMAQSGLHIPAAEGSRLPVFPQVFADIGDEQSVSQNLSTFSSHMTQIVRVIRQAGALALVLLDEIGAGTDPAEGSALAKAVLAELVRRQARVVATTHYGELKAFAYAHPGIENASMEFDLVTLKPTFHVRIGLPGSSHAFAIARSLGLPDTLLAAARGMIGPAEVALDEVIQRVEEDQRALAEERIGAEAERGKLRQARHEYEALLADLKKRRAEELRAARQEAKRIIAEAKAQAESLLALLRETVEEARKQESALAKATANEPAALTRVAREELAEIAAAVETATQEAEPETSAERESEPVRCPVGALKLGDEVYLRSIGQKGTVLTLPDDAGQLDLQVGILKIRAQLSDLEKPSWVEPDRSYPDHVEVEPRHVPAEIHLRGMRVDEALYELEKYLDDAQLARLREVRIVHGKGTGAVRQAVHQFLKNHPAIESFRFAEAGEGDYGATVARLKG